MRPAILQSHAAVHATTSCLKAEVFLGHGGDQAKCCCNQKLHLSNMVAVTGEGGKVLEFS